MKGLVADANIQGQVEHLVKRMRADTWADFWRALDLVLYRFEDVGLLTSATDLEVWNVCQAEELILITDNRNLDSEDSLPSHSRIFDVEHDRIELFLAHSLKTAASAVDLCGYNKLLSGLDKPGKGTHPWCATVLPTS